MRIAGITIPDNKRIEIGLTAIYGIGRPKAQKILSEVGIDGALKPKDIKAEAENALRKIIEAAQIEGELRRLVAANVKRLKDIKSYRGSRHAKNLPSRGQRTKSNSRTRRGNQRKTMGSGRKKLDKK